MINIKTHIYSKLSADTAITAIVGDNIHVFSDDTDEMENFDDRLPQITYARIGGTVTRSGVRQETFQLSAWSKTAGGAEILSQELVRLFNRTHDTTYRNCAVESVNDSHDQETKAYGVHITARFTLLDTTY